MNKYTYELLDDIEDIKESRQDVQLNLMLAQQSSVWQFSLPLVDDVLGVSRSVYEMAEAISYFNDKCNFYWILHDKDRKDDGTLKNAHIHLILSFPHRQRLSRVLSYLMRAFRLKDIDYIVKRYDENNEYKYVVSPWVTFSQTLMFDRSLRYLIHLDDKDKYQYPSLDVQSNDKETFEIAISVDSAESQKASYFVNLVKMYRGDFQEIAMHMRTADLEKHFFIIRELCKTYNHNRR